MFVRSRDGRRRCSARDPIINRRRAPLAGTSRRRTVDQLRQRPVCVIRFIYRPRREFGASAVDKLPQSIPPVRHPLPQPTVDPPPRALPRRDQHPGRKTVSVIKLETRPYYMRFVTVCTRLSSVNRNNACMYIIMLLCVLDFASESLK